MAASSNPIHFVVGPTASGKSDYALDLAVQIGGAIVNADSVQVYKGLDIGSAKPTAADRARVPHFLYDLVSPDQTFTAAEFRREALAIIERELPRRPLIFVGGSGFYLQALEKGMYDVAEPDASIEADIARLEATEGLWAALKRLDPQSADRIKPADTYRQRRALEMILTSGKTLLEIEADFRAIHGRLGDRYPLRKVGMKVNRDVLKQRVERRTERMLAQGLINEVRGLIAAGYGNARALGAVGYKECALHLEGLIPLEELQGKIVTSTMQLAKRQMTWFKRDPEIEWREMGA